MNEITLKYALDSGTEILTKLQIPDAGLDAWYLMEYYFHIDRMNYLMNKEKKIQVQQFDDYIELINRRASRVPLQHITGQQEFMGLEYFTDASVLIPRQDTEILVEEVMKEASGKTVLDLCTGSGCIIVSLAKLCDLKGAAGADISENALRTARKNAFRHQVDVSLIQSDLFEGITGRYDIIVSNPPYISTSEIEELMPEVKDFEPRIALDGKEDGLFFYRRIIEKAPEYSNPGGMIFFEIGYDQADKLYRLLTDGGFDNIEVIKDLAGHNRVVKGRLHRWRNYSDV